MWGNMFFDIEALRKQANDDPALMLKMLENWYYNKIPKNERDRKNFSKVHLSGDSWIKEPKRLFFSKVDPIYKYQYLILCSKRNHLDYRLYGIEYLDLSYFPDLNINKIKGNPLLEVKDNKLHFKI